jgi:hypothetical protein
MPCQVDGAAGEKLVYRRRGEPQTNPHAPPSHPVKLHFVLDCSGSMYRFNGEVWLPLSLTPVSNSTCWDFVVVCWCAGRSA